MQDLKSEKLAIFGGRPTLVERVSFPSVIGIEEERAVLSVLRSGILSRSRQGECVKQFEVAFAEYFKRKYSVSTSSGTAALHVAVRALDIGPGDEVLVPALTFISTASVVLQEKATPVFVDIEPDTFNIDPRDLEKKISKKTKAIIVVHLYGNPVNMTRIVGVAQKHKLPIIEDCAQAHGAEYAGKRVGSFGDIASYSFQQSKNMICGEGGMIVTDNKELYEKCASVVNHGLVNGDLRGYDYDRLGYNYHMTELQAAVALEQLKKLKNMNSLRMKNADLYKKYLADTELVFQKDTNDSHPVYYCLTALLPEHYKDKRDWFVDAVRAENSEILKLYPLPLTRTKLFNQNLNICPIAENVSARLFNFFTTPGLTEDYIKKSCEATKKVLNYLHENK